MDVGTTLSMEITSVQTQFSYPIDVWLPPGYSDGTARYPVVYATDCEYRWPDLLQDVQGFAAQGGTKVILINICAGSTDRRLVDFTMPGAAAYYRFLTLELIPLIDATYRTDPTNRTLSGHSLSGEFAIWALYLEDPAHRFFSSIVSAAGSFWVDDSSQESSTATDDPLATAYDNAMFAATNSDLPINLVFAGDYALNLPRVSELNDQFTARKYHNLRQRFGAYGFSHTQMDGPSFADALAFIFAGN
jgi:predicted alpha/beta superfamily hydrolase